MQRIAVFGFALWDPHRNAMVPFPYKGTSAAIQLFQGAPDLRSRQLVYACQLDGNGFLHGRMAYSIDPALCSLCGCQKQEERPRTHAP